MGLLGAEHGRSPMQRAAELAHRHLRLDFVSVTEVTGESVVFRAVAGDGRSFGLVEGQSRPAGGTYAEALLSRRIPSLVRDAALDERTARLPMTHAARVRAFIGVPLRYSDGSVYGALCCAGHLPDHALTDKDVRFLDILADLMTPVLDEERERAKVYEQLLDVVERDTAEVAFQPIVDVRTRRCLGVEALARFPDPLSGPAETIAAGYDVGLGLELERMMARRAWPVLEALTGSTFLSINLTPSAALTLAPRARERSDLPLSHLVVEITENAVVERYDTLRFALEPLRSRGLRIAIDDMGAGYASFRHVVELNPDVIKIDRSLVDGVAESRERRLTVAAFVRLALDMGALAVAEGVERAEDFSALAELGVHAVQGYLLAKPSSAPADLIKWLGLQRAPADPVPSDVGAS